MGEKKRRVKQDFDVSCHVVLKKSTETEKLKGKLGEANFFRVTGRILPSPPELCTSRCSSRETLSMDNKEPAE